MQQQRPTAPQVIGMTVGDIYFVLFRHKWKIILCSLAGLLAAAALYVLKPPPYQSEAKLFVRYVLETRSPATVDEDAKIKSPDSRGDDIINSEIEILTSWDLAQQVADLIGPDKILAGAGGGRDRNTAATLISRNLQVDAPKKSSVIHMVFQHPDPQLVQPVLSALIDAYIKKHLEIHQPVRTFDDFLTQQTDQLRSRLSQTEVELQKAKSKVGIISLEDAKKAYAEQIVRTRQTLFDAEADLAGRQAALAAIPQPAPASAPATNNIPAVATAAVDEYQSVRTRLDLLRKREQELRLQFTDQNSLVKDVRDQIALAEEHKTALEQKYPTLASPAVTALRLADRSVGPLVDGLLEAGQIAALQSRIKVLNSQFEQLQSEAAQVDAAEPAILELQRKKTIDESNYQAFSASLEQARIDESLGAGRVTNISRIQAASPPFRDRTKTMKQVAGVGIGGLLGGLALAFILEFYLDHSLKRPGEIETKLRLPLMLAIPDLCRNGHRHLIKAGQNVSQVLQPFNEALRDRLVTYFEVRGLTHKPKLVAVTGASRNSGITTIATGLAACLSETGDGKVLLVDFSRDQCAAQQFCQGKPVCGLDEALYTQNNALVQDNLYVASEGSDSDKLPRILPKRFTMLVPKLKISDYDYIIFDMPPITQTSVTPRLAGFMDMVLLVLEAEETNREVAQRANVLLAESKATVCAVLNKAHHYVPRWLHEDFLTNS